MEVFLGSFLHVDVPLGKSRVLKILRLHTLYINIRPFTIIVSEMN